MYRGLIKRKEQHMKYIIKKINIKTIDYAQYKDYFACASEERQKKAMRYRREEDSIRCIMGEVLLKKALNEYGEAIGHYEIKSGKHGKPYLEPVRENIKKLYYNISHSGEWVYLILSDDEVGIDVEKITDKATGIARRFFTENENRYIAHSEHPDEAFTRLWTIKEAYIKYLGTGLSKDLKSFEINITGDKVLITDEGVTQNVLVKSTKKQEYFVAYVTYNYNNCMKETEGNEKGKNISISNISNTDNVPDCVCADNHNNDLDGQGADA